MSRQFELMGNQLRFLRWVYLHANINSFDRIMIHKIMEDNYYTLGQKLKLRFIRHKHGREYFDTIKAFGRKG